MKTSDFDYNLPEELIAQVPIESRSQSRLLVLNRSDGRLEHRVFTGITEYLKQGDVLIFNNSRVIPARLKGRRVDSGGNVEILLLRRLGEGTWQTMVKPGKRIRNGARVEIRNNNGDKTVIAETIDSGEGGTRIIKFSDESMLPDMGEIPLPPYIHVPLTNRERYQTVYSKPEGSAAAPTAGLHFTSELIEKIREMGVTCLFTTLHIGLDTFRPVKEENPVEHIIHREYGILDADTAREINLAKKEGRRVICVGTTSVRLVEAAAQADSKDEIQPYEGWVDLFILPGYRFKIADAMITNFHLPRSTLIMLVSAFAGEQNIRNAYSEAIERKYRFYSFGDAMLII
jgi:S-adenosylmethionine:tRNA ribosyltransferase-isomerase